MNTLEVIAGALGGQVVLLGTVAFLFKSLVSNMLARDAKRLEIEIKARADTEIERVKASLSRMSVVHGKQIEVLTQLYNELGNAQAYFQRATSSVIREGDPPQEKVIERCLETMASSYGIYSSGRLLLPIEIATQCDQFFARLYEGQNNLAFARHEMIVDGNQRAELWDKAKKVAHRDLPSILERIDRSARQAIHG